MALSQQGIYLFILNLSHCWVTNLLLVSFLSWGFLPPPPLLYLRWWPCQINISQAIGACGPQAISSLKQVSGLIFNVYSECWESRKEGKCAQWIYFFFALEQIQINSSCADEREIHLCAAQQGSCKLQSIQLLGCRPTQPYSTQGSLFTALVWLSPDLQMSIRAFLLAPVGDVYSFCLVCFLLITFCWQLHLPLEEQMCSHISSNYWPMTLQWEEPFWGWSGICPLQSSGSVNVTADNPEGWLEQLLIAQSRKVQAQCFTSGHS